MSTPAVLCVDETVLAEVKRRISLHEHFGTGCDSWLLRTVSDGSRETPKKKSLKKGGLILLPKIPAGKVLWEVQISF